LLETWLVPVEGYLVDRFGPRLVVLAGAFLCGIAWAMNAYADSLMFLYGRRRWAAWVQARCTDMRRQRLEMVSGWRGLAAGLTAGVRRGIGTDDHSISVAIKSSGYESTFLYFGIGQGVIVVATVPLILASPRKGEVPETSNKLLQTSRPIPSHGSGEAARVLGYYLCSY